jgi:integrase
MQRVWYRKSAGCWYATFTEDGRQKQLRLVKGPHDRRHKKLAEQKLLDELKARPAARDSSAKKAPDWLTVRGVLKGFLRFSKKHHEPTSYAWYRNFFRSFARLFGNLRVSQLARKHVSRWLETAGYNPTSANRAVGAIKAAFNWAVAEEHIPGNPIAHVKKPRGLVRDRVLTPEERQLILGSIRDERFRNFVEAMTLTGCRPGEVAKVAPEHVELTRGVWVFPKHKTVKKTGKPRVVYLCPEAIELTRRLLKEHPDGPLFRNTRGHPWTRNAIRIRFRNLRRKHPELKGVIAYTYRASFATDALEAGVPDTTVSTLLGHVGGTGTLHRFYARLAHKVDHLRDAAARATQDRPPAGDGPPGSGA